MVMNRRDTIRPCFPLPQARSWRHRLEARNFSNGPAALHCPSPVEQDFEGTLARIATLGYRAGRICRVYASSLHQTATILKRYGLFARQAT